MELFKKYVFITISFVITIVFLILVQLSFRCAFIIITMIVSILLLYWQTSSIPSRANLQRDILRLQSICPKLINNTSFDSSHVIKYYSSTSFRDYKLFELGTGCSAMHTELHTPFNLGFYTQCMYVIAHMKSTSNTLTLEVGCGKGANSIFLSSLFPDSNFIACDLLDSHIEYAKTKNKNKNIEFVHSNVLEMHLPISSVDIVFGIESFCHLDSIPQMHAFLKKTHSFLKPRGKIIIVDAFRTNNFNQQSKNVQCAMTLAESAFKINIMNSKQTWINTAKSYNFSLLSTINLTDNALPFWIMGQKVARLLLYTPFFGYMLMKWAPESGSNFIAVLMIAYTLYFQAAEYGVLVFELAS